MKRKTVLYKGPGGTRVHLEMKLPAEIVKDLGLDRNGDTQYFHTTNVLRRIKRYMPFRFGFMYKMTVAQSPISRSQIVTDLPQAKYLFYGRKMVNAKTGKGPRMIPGIGPRYRKGTVLKSTDVPLNYFQGKNQAAGPRWDKALVAAEGKAMAEDIRRYIARRKRS